MTLTLPIGQLTCLWPTRQWPTRLWLMCSFLPHPLISCSVQNQLLMAHAMDLFCAGASEPADERGANYDNMSEGEREEFEMQLVREHRSLGCDF